MTVKATAAYFAVITDGGPESSQVLEEKDMPVGEVTPPAPAMAQEDTVLLPVQPETVFAPLTPIYKVATGDA